MKYQVIVLDLDGTLTNSKKEITPPTRDALIEIQQNGKKVTEKCTLSTKKQKIFLYCCKKRF